MKERAVDLGKTASSSDIIFDALRDEIISGNLKAGESIRQEYIAKIFNVSRIPVREALKRLEAQGLVKNERYKGAIVSSLSEEEFIEIYEIRLLLEPLVIKEAARRITPETLKIAESYCNEFSAEPDSNNWGKLNRKFHEALYRDSKKPFHLKIINEASDRIDPYIRAQLVLTHGMEQARIEHNEILDACRNGDGEKAAKLTYDHIQDSYNALIPYLRKITDGA
ncbi:MAG: GntR family transcriptional regulator [Methylocystaceae bacterium]|nr:GntR family transcriptional regulator [Methylocystaceae bacterium]